MRYEWYLYVSDEGGFRTLLGNGVGDEVAIPDDTDPDDLDPFSFDAHLSAEMAARAAISALHNGEQVFLNNSGSGYLECEFPLPAPDSRYLVFITPSTP